MIIIIHTQSVLVVTIVSSIAVSTFMVPCTICLIIIPAIIIRKRRENSQQIIRNEEHNARYAIPPHSRRSRIPMALQMDNPNRLFNYNQPEPAPEHVYDQLSRPNVVQRSNQPLSVPPSAIPTTHNLAYNQTHAAANIDHSNSYHDRSSLASLSCTCSHDQQMFHEGLNRRGYINIMPADSEDCLPNSRQQRNPSSTREGSSNPTGQETFPMSNQMRSRVISPLSVLDPDEASCLQQNEEPVFSHTQAFSCGHQNLEQIQGNLDRVSPSRNMHSRARTLLNDGQQGEQVYQNVGLEDNEALVLVEQQTSTEKHVDIDPPQMCESDMTHPNRNLNNTLESNIENEDIDINDCAIDNSSVFHNISTDISHVYSQIEQYEVISGYEQIITGRAETVTEAVVVSESDDDSTSESMALLHDKC